MRPRPAPTGPLQPTARRGHSCVACAEHVDPAWALQAAGWADRCAIPSTSQGLPRGAQSSRQVLGGANSRRQPDTVGQRQTPRRSAYDLIGTGHQETFVLREGHTKDSKPWKPYADGFTGGKLHPHSATTWANRYHRSPAVGMKGSTRSQFMPTPMSIRSTMDDRLRGFGGIDRPRWAQSRAGPCRAARPLYAAGCTSKGWRGSRSKPATRQWQKGVQATPRG
jgi:hypothetical protein